MNEKSENKKWKYAATEDNINIRTKSTTKAKNAIIKANINIMKRDNNKID